MAVFPLALAGAGWKLSSTADPTIVVNSQVGPPDSLQKWLLYKWQPGSMFIMPQRFLYNLCSFCKRFFFFCGFCVCVCVCALFVNASPAKSPRNLKSGLLPGHISAPVIKYLQAKFFPQLHLCLQSHLFYLINLQWSWHRCIRRQKSDQQLELGSQLCCWRTKQNRIRLTLP